MRYALELRIGMGWILMGTLEKSLERRWVLLSSDGRFVTLGRASDPSEEEIVTAEIELRTRGLAGWLAIMEGNPYIGPVPHIMEVRPLADPAASFVEASAACIASIVARRAELAN